MICPWDFMRHAIVLDTLDDGAGFFLILGEVLEKNFVPLAFFGPEMFAAAARVVFDDGVGGFEDDGGGTVVLFQLHDFDFRKVFFEFEEVGDFGAAPAIDALVIITDNAEIAMFFGEEIDELKLGGVGVLILIHHDVLEMLAATF
ncbi:MAG: hypothetical protein JWN25_1620, partial [Verrucomicrobiales bacterium]|nr:hypothetical protein [Verrucomicrobiales bacterium]